MAGNSPRIPTYSPQVGTPKGRVGGFSANIPNSPHLDASGFADFADRFQKKREETELNDARAQLAAEEPRAQLAHAQEFSRIQQEWTPDSAPIADQMSAFTDSYRAEAEKRITHPRARELLSEQSNGFKSHYMLQGHAFETQKRVEMRIDTAERGYQDAANLGGIDPSRFGQSIAVLGASIMEDTQIPQSAKPEFIRKQSNLAALQAAKSRAELDPRRVMQFADRILGVDSGEGGGLEAQLRAEGVPDDVIRQISMAEQSGADIDVTVAAEDLIDPQSDEGTMFRLLDADQLMQVRSIAAANLAEEKRQKSDAMKVQADLFKQRLKDVEVALQNGDTTAEIPTDSDLSSFLDPADALLTKQRLMNLQSMAGGLRALGGATNADLETIANMPNPQGSADRENRQEVRNTVAKRASDLLAARKADPGMAALNGSPQVRQAFDAWKAAAADFYNAGPNPTPEQSAQMSVARGGFINQLFAIQRGWGVQRPTLPKTVVESMAEGFAVQMERDPVRAAADLAKLPDLLGNDAAVAQVANKIGPIGHLAMDGVPGLTLAKIRAIQLAPEGERMKLLPSGTTKRDIDDEVTAAFEPFFETLAYQKDAVSANRYRAAANALVIDKMNRGANAKEAANAAYAELFSDRNAINGTYRVDRMKYDPAAVDAGLGVILSVFPADGLQATPEPGFSLEESQARKLRTVRKSAYWVNTGDGLGVYLMHDAGPVYNKNGAPIIIRFDDAAKSARPLQKMRAADYAPPADQAPVF